MGLKDFQILSRIGSGTYSSVWQAKRISDDELYAIKKVRMENLKEKEMMNCLNEVRLLASINSPHVVAFKEVLFEDSQTLCIIMEYMGGGDLYGAIIKHQKAHTYFKEKDIWRYIAQMILGLKSLHDRKILHRDLKSANIFLSKDEKIAKLGDLNVSKVVKNNLAYTQTGTPYYASPEVWRDEPYDAKSDIWSLGCLVYELCALKPPFRAHDMASLCKKIQKGVFDKIPSQYSEDLFGFISLCLQVQSTKRPSCKELLENPIIQRNCQEVLETVEDVEGSKELLNTIRLSKHTKNLRSMKLKLPQANYQKLAKSASLDENSIKRPLLRNLQQIVEQQILNSEEKIPLKSMREKSPQEETTKSTLMTIHNSDILLTNESCTSPTNRHQLIIKPANPHKDYLRRMRKEYMERSKPTRLLEILPKVNSKNPLREHELPENKLRKGRSADRVELSQEESDTYLEGSRNLRDDYVQFKDDLLSEDRYASIRKQSVSRKLLKEGTEDLVENYVNSSHTKRILERIGNKINKNPMDAMEKRAQLLIQKYQQPVRVIDKNEELSRRDSSNLRNSRLSPELEEKSKLGYDIQTKILKLNNYDKHNASPVLRRIQYSEKNGDSRNRKANDMKTIEQINIDLLKNQRDKSIGRSQRPG